jgi:hypothetical protein
MADHDPIAYTYEADYHCPACTEERFGRTDDGYIAGENADGTVSEDTEGNAVGAVFPWDEWCQGTDEAETLACSDCGCVIDETEATTSAAYDAEFLRGYEEYADFTDSDQLTRDATSDEPGRQAIDVYGWHASTEETFSSDCASFCDQNASDLLACGLSAHAAGGDFWLTRSGHGAGFWDHGHVGEVEDAALQRLAEASRSEGTCELYVGDDGWIYCP